MDVEIEKQLTNARQVKVEDTTDDDVFSTSGRQFSNATFFDLSHSKVWKFEK